MELPAGRSIPAGDPREDANPYGTSYPFGYGSLSANKNNTAARTTPKSQKLGPNRGRHTRTQMIPDSSDFDQHIERQLPYLRAAQVKRAKTINVLAQASREQTGRELPIDVRRRIADQARYEDSRIPLDLEPVFQAASLHDTFDKRQREEINESTREAKRQRNYKLLNQFVGQNVPAATPFQRSFIPHDLQHMLSGANP